MDHVVIENRAGLARVTCGWKKPELPLAFVRPYWRDAHSPAIARRAGLHEYRHYPLDPIQADLFTPVDGIDLAGKPGEQLMWLSDVRYPDEDGMKAFSATPPARELAQILNDINLIVDKSTTYKVIGENGWTFVDKGIPAPQGPAQAPTFGVFFRQKGDEVSFRAALRRLAACWADVEGVVRVRMALFEVPDMEAERKAGYPVKTHPVEMQYQAWIDLMVTDIAVARPLLTLDAGIDPGTHFTAIHAYPSPAVYTFNYNGRPTLSGLRGYPAVEAIRNLSAEHQKDLGLLEWMYGPVVQGGPLA